MSERDNGGPAFPKTREAIIDSRSAGMTLRDWFAGQALAGLVQLRAVHEAARESGEPAEKITAAAAYEYADAMLEARK